MPRNHPPLSEVFPYHVTARTNNQAWFQIPMPEVWEIFTSQLTFVARAYGLQIHAAVLMQNHFHLICQDPECQVSLAMRWLMTETARTINRQAGSKNHLFGQRHYRSQMTHPQYFRHAYKYLYRNPVEAGLCRRVEEYPFSTLPALLGMDRLRVPMVTDHLLMENCEETLRWLNTTPLKKELLEIRKALKSVYFTLPVSRKTRKLHPLELRDY